MEKIRFGWGNHDKIGQNLKQLHLFWPFLHHFLCAKSMISSPEELCMVEAVSILRLETLKAVKPRPLVEAVSVQIRNAWTPYWVVFCWTKLEALFAQWKKTAKWLGECFQNAGRCFLAPRHQKTTNFNFTTSTMGKPSVSARPNKAHGLGIFHMITQWRIADTWQMPRRIVAKSWPP